MPEEPRPDEGDQATAQGRLAQQLRELRASVGNPSFRRMAGASGYISHTTLHEAASGTRFPSWETTREFVKACGGDEREWRERWEAARNATRADEPATTGAAKAVDDDTPSDASAGSSDGAPASEGVRPARQRRLFALIAALAVALIAVLAVVVVRLGGGDPDEAGADGQAAPGGPAESTQPTGPLYPGDLSRFITDVTIPDGTVVHVNQEFLKVWEIENAGTVIWRGRALQREDLPQRPGTCVTPDRVPIYDTLPNERVKISVSVVAPSTPGTCMVKWKMVDDQGRLTMPTSRPVYFLVHVEP